MKCRCSRSSPANSFARHTAQGVNFTSCRVPRPQHIRAQGRPMLRVLAAARAPKEEAQQVFDHGRAALRNPDFDYNNDDWMQQVDSEVGWQTFWDHLEFFTQDDEVKTVVNEDGYEEETTECLHHEGRQVLEAEEKMCIALTALDKMRLSKDSNFVVPSLANTVQSNDPDPVQRQLRVRETDVDVWTLRARREKRLAKKLEDHLWELEQEAQRNLPYLDISDLSDKRCASKLRDEKLHWTDAEIRNLIVNDGQSVDPKVVLESSTFLVQNPDGLWDWAGQGIDYIEETEDWLRDLGHWMDSEADLGDLPDMAEDADLTDFDTVQPRSGEVTGEAADMAVNQVMQGDE